MGRYKNSECEESWGQRDSYFAGIRLLYNNAVALKNQTLFLKWKDDFTKIHGNLDGQRKADLDDLSSTFNLSIEGEASLFYLLFSLETYYSIILRFIVAKKVLQITSFSRDFFQDSFYVKSGLANYTCPESLNWFQSINNIDSYLSEVYKELNLASEDIAVDHISVLFEQIFPKEVRHGLGEYYTPYWLAKHVISEIISKDDELESRSYLDPTCGSGTFLLVLIDLFHKDQGDDIFSRVYGIDINPLTVLAAKTNYLIAYSKYRGIHKDSLLNIPIYYADTMDIQHNGDATLFPDENEYDIVPNIQFDYIVGNPPWVNWEYLPLHYKAKYSYLWEHYGLFSRKGLSTNFIKEDISVLITYVVINRFLKIGGKIAFILKETLFKSIKQGEGFRLFYIAPSDTPICVMEVDDLSKINPFHGAVTRAALWFAIKGEKTNYPIDYYVWTPRTKVHIKNNTYLDIRESFSLEHLLARPSKKDCCNSGWITESEQMVSQSDKILGRNGYIARTGTFTGGANGIYWLNIIDEADDRIRVRNITNRAKNKMKTVEATMEKDFVFPFLTGSELSFWEYSYSKYIVCPHTAQTKMFPIDYSQLNKYPLTQQYFECFKKELIERKGFTSMDESIHMKYYYTLQRIGDYSYAPYKVCWRYISKHFTPAVVEYSEDRYLGHKNIICNEKIIYIGIDNKEEAYYLCGIISSTPYRETIESFMVGTQITPSIINKLYIPKFDRSNQYHCIISNHCYLGHQLGENKEQHLNAIDDAVRGMLDI